MTAELKIKRLDSPLSRDRSTGERPTEPAADPAPAPAKPPRRRTPTATTTPRASRAATEPREQTAVPAALALPDPPPLEEPLELISSRLPTSLRRSLSDLTAALRGRSGGRLSQKSLPEQEVLAVLIWAAGSAEDPDAIARLAATVSEYRARRYAAAAEALRQ